MFAPPLITKVWLLFPKSLKCGYFTIQTKIILDRAEPLDRPFFCSRIGEVTDATLLSWGGALAHSSRPPSSLFSPLQVVQSHYQPSRATRREKVSRRYCGTGLPLGALRQPIPRHRGIVTCYGGEATPDF